MGAVRDLDAVCVYCGSSPGADPAYAEAADAVGRHLAEAGVRVVYGGGAVGLMGRLADAALGAGGEVVGVMPRGVFQREVGHQGVTELIEVGSMHERKLRMFELSDAFVALPGGLGTLEELTEMLTWAQLGLHALPVATLDVNGFWAPFHELLRNAVRTGFMKEENLGLVVNVDEVGSLLDVLRSHEVPYTGKWLGLDET